MNTFVLFLVLLKATLTSFAGLASISVVRDELVVQRHVLTDAQLNEAVVVTRSTPGPVGLYVVAVGYEVAGTPGAIAGWAAMTAPGLAVIPLLVVFRRHLRHPRVRSGLQAIVIASAALLLATVLPFARTAITGPVTAVAALATLPLVVRFKVDPSLIIAGAAAVAMACYAANLTALL
ncbi:chromate transporter [Ralstonia pseudosolanacearum]|uniref:chromate transporter n=1 Tax=Ralstonia pseudosolanacearum TaxID=1310165 RepID=UPI003AAD6F33